MPLPPALVSAFRALAGLATGLMGYCPVYSLLGINTCGVKAKLPAAE
jgi:hypothetical protein